MWQALLQPEAYWPLLIDVALGFAVVAFTRRVMRRCLGLSLIPFIVAVTYVGPHVFELWGKSSEGTGGWVVAGIIVFLQGLVASGVGGLLGCFIRRKKIVIIC
jgi:hypothetical protein